MAWDHHRLRIISPNPMGPLADWGLISNFCCSRLGYLPTRCQAFSVMTPKLWNVLRLKRFKELPFYWAWESERSLEPVTLQMLLNNNSHNPWFTCTKIVWRHPFFTELTAMNILICLCKCYFFIPTINHYPTPLSILPHHFVNCKKVSLLNTHTHTRCVVLTTQTTWHWQANKHDLKSKQTIVLINEGHFLFVLKMYLVPSKFLF